MSKAEDLKIEAEQVRQIEEMQVLAEERYLLQSGLARSRWKNNSIPDSILGKNTGKPINTNENFVEWWEDPGARYESGDNFLIGGGLRESRMTIASAMALRVRQFQNKFPRDVIGYKHDRPLIHGVTGEQLSWPYTFNFMDVTQLGEMKRRIDQEIKNNRDENVRVETFEEAVCQWDFFFLSEVGHEWPTTWNAKLIEDFIYARGDEGLPIVMSLSKSPSGLEDKYGVEVYKEFAAIVKPWKGVGI